MLVHIRLQAGTREEAAACAAFLTDVLGESLTLSPPRPGRGAGVWFVRGTLHTSGATVAAVIPATGEVVTVPAPPDAEQAARLSRLSGLTRPQSRPDDGVNRRELHKRLQELHNTQKGATDEPTD